MELEIEASILEQEIQQANGELTRWLAGRPESIRALARRMANAPLRGSERDGCFVQPGVHSIWEPGCAGGGCE